MSDHHIPLSLDGDKVTGVGGEPQAPAKPWKGNLSVDLRKGALSVNADGVTLIDEAGVCWAIVFPDKNGFYEHAVTIADALTDRAYLEITKAEIMAIGDTVTTLRKIGHSEGSSKETLWQILRRHGLPLDEAQWICNDALNAGLLSSSEVTKSAERMWCTACGTVTRDQLCDCNQWGEDVCKPNFVNYADAMQEAAHEQSQRVGLLEEALEKIAELTDERGEIGSTARAALAADGARQQEAWDAPHNRTYEPVEKRAAEIYATFVYDEAGEKPAWKLGGNSLKQDEARQKARDELRAGQVVTRPHQNTTNTNEG